MNSHIVGRTCMRKGQEEGEACEITPNVFMDEIHGKEPYEDDCFAIKMSRK